MKNFTCILLIVIFSCCQKIMHEEDYKISQIKSYDEMNVAISGVYARLAQYINNWYTTPQYLADDMPYVVYLPYSTNDTVFTYYYFRLWFTDDNWQKLYKIIASVNNIICQFKNNQSINNEMKVCLGELYLIRAYSYFRLVRIFGAVPIVDNIEINYTLPRSTIKEVYAFIESDLLKAADYLPVSRASARVPNQSPTRGSAKAMLAEVYLTMGGYPLLDNTKYSLAAKIAKEVIDSSSIYGFNILPDYANLWDGSDMLNHEALFGLFFSTHGTTLVRQKIRYHYRNGPYLVYVVYTSISDNFSPETTNDFSFAAIYDTSFSYQDVLSQIIPKRNFFLKFPISYRKDITFQNIFPSNKYKPDFYDPHTSNYKRILKYTKYNTWNDQIFYKKFGLIINFDTVSTATEFGHVGDYFSREGDSIYYGKLIPDSATKQLRFFSLNMGQPIYIYRYAHTLLTYAEAKARSGQLDASAYEAVNMIRRRANKVDINSPSKYDLLPGLSAQQFADSVVQERAWEFCAEPEGRWFDLVRCEMTEQLPKLRGDNHEMTKSDYFDAIPSGDKVLNPNLN